MRPLCLLFFALLSACTAWDRSNGSSQYSRPQLFPSAPDSSSDSDRSSHATPGKPPEKETHDRNSSQPLLQPSIHRLTSRGVAFTLLAFDDRSHLLSIADQEKGPGAEWQSAKAAARAHKAVAAVNAGFFTPEGGPLGLVVENGTHFGSWNSASSLTSGVLTASGNTPRLLRRHRWNRTNRTDHLVQAGPFLLENSRPVSGLSADSNRPRSFIAKGNAHHWIIGHAKSATLHRLAEALAAQPVPGLRLQTALNLDGGRSSDLWIDSSIDGGPVSVRSFWNKPVRNYVLVTEHNASSR